MNKGLEGGELGMRAHSLRELHAETTRRSGSQREPHVKAQGGAIANDPGRARLCVAREAESRSAIFNRLFVDYVCFFKLYLQT